MFRMLLLVALIGLVVTAIYRHWVTLSFTREDGNARASLNIHENRFHEDVAGFREKVQGQEKNQAKIAKGKVLSVDPARNLIAVEDNGTVNIEVPKGIPIRMGTEERTLSDLRPGTVVTVTYVVTNGRHSAQSISIEAP